MTYKPSLALRRALIGAALAGITAWASGENKPHIVLAAIYGVAAGFGVDIDAFLKKPAATPPAEPTPPTPQG